jgi:hypothetical protein
MEIKQIDIFGGESKPVLPPNKKGRKPYEKMQSIYGITQGKICKTCKHCVRLYYHGRTYFKCELWHNSNSATTDIRLKDVACGKYEEGCAEI